MTIKEKSVLLATLSAEDRQKLRGLAQPVRFAAGQQIFYAGDPGDTLLMVDSGRLEISITSQSGRKSVLNHMGPGEVLGEIAILDGGLRSADVTAATDVTGLSLHRRELFAFLMDQPEAVFGLIRELCEKVRNASEMFSVQSQTNAQVRLARCLLRLGAKWGVRSPDGTVCIAGSFSQSDLGEFSGLARENVNRQLKAWSADKLVEITNSGITLKNIEALESLAQI
ncbi:Crp/Fnr family transcriptional regulator [Thalassovita taeanensis]|uniref:cAMP-binding domain of CRP or a regulatory subunit of cAMP-dependent protein kinases n=1 Tax=Thalassovita taeanensis TaxID=657014 RepID=A0A1H9CAW0_9RHOB|nr:Crp/Fnr family transcriptional regulator [Thalassovita taeanensis]SEP98131.1 cAMP-binding domain of CRP or a regulatory subunit of cAMP-dependent protein kinases [Thalassovita taeanensis]